MIATRLDIRKVRPETEAELTRVRRQGWCVVDQELELGLRSAAAPLTAHGRTVAAINVSTTSTTTLERLREVHVPALVATAAAISVELDATTLSA